MAGIGTSDDDDKSLVQSIHSLLQDVNRKDTGDEITENERDPLLSCDTYIDKKLSVQASQVNAICLYTFSGSVQ